MFTVGLIRKTLMVGTLGIVRGSSKKQRVAKKSLQELRTQTSLQQAALQQQAAWQQQQQQQQAQATAHAPQAAPAPGWYPSNVQPGALQWWDGTRWTEHVRPTT